MSNAKGGSVSDRSVREVIFRDEGLIGFQEAWDIQTALNRQLIADKRGAADGIGSHPHYLLFCEHDPVYTLGKSGSESHLKADLAFLDQIKAKFMKINRGGDITYHGPGQVVGYPIFDLERIFTDVHKYVRSIEEVIILTLRHFGLDAGRLEGFTGVWLNSDGGHRKICAIGVHLSRWVTMHGFALNVDPDLSHFDHIVPCGIGDDDKTVTSMAKELAGDVNIDTVKMQLKDNFARVFDLKYM